MRSLQCVSTAKMFLFLQLATCHSYKLLSQNAQLDVSLPDSSDLLALNKPQNTGKHLVFQNSK